MKQRYLLILISFSLYIGFFSVRAVMAQQPGLLWDVATNGRIDASAVSADGTRIAFGARDNVLRMLDGGGNQLWTFEASNSILGVDMTPDGLLTVVASEDRFVYLLDENGETQWNFKTGKPVTNASIAKDGSLVVATSADLSVYGFDGEGNLLWQEPLGIGVEAVSVYGSGEKARAVVGSDGGFITIYSRAGKELLTAAVDYGVQSVDVTSNGGRILAGMRNGTAVLLNGANGNEIWQFKSEALIHSVALANDGSAALVGSDDDNAYLLDSDGVLIQQFEQKGPALSVALSANGQKIAIGTESGTGRFFDRESALAEVSAATTQQRRTISGVVIALLAVMGLAVWAIRGTDSGARVWTQASVGPRAFLGAIWQARYSYLLILPTLILLLTFNYYPAFSGLYHAFTDWNPAGQTEWIGLANFEFLLKDRFFLSSFRNVLILVIVQFIKTLTFPLIVAELIFNLRNRFGQYWMRTLFVVPIVLPAVVEILVWNNIYDPAIGLLNETLKLVGLEEWVRVWYGDSQIALWSILFIGVPWVNAFALLIYYGGLISISDEIIDSSRVDGASTWRRFWSLDLPLLMGQIKLLLILNFINAVQTFELVFLTTGGGPGAATYTPALELYYMAMRMDRMGVASAIGMVLFIIILIGTIINMRYVQSSTEFEA
ncbi:MAG: PQQ-binding-like beta-propeller repeat protein [Chloroflexota bacterium]